MAHSRSSQGKITFQPLTNGRWRDFEALFGQRGACGGCWCMWWRQTRAQFQARHGEQNRRAMKRIVESGEVPGILAFRDGRAVGWCSIAPRECYASLERSRVMKRLDDEPVWSIVCLYVPRVNRGQGLAGALVRGALDHAARHGARIVEAYPTVPRGRTLADISSFMGVPALYERAGFTLVARPSAARAIMRRELTPPGRGMRRRRAPAGQNGAASRSATRGGGTGTASRAPGARGRATGTASRAPGARGGAGRS